MLILKQRLQAGIPASVPIIGANGLNTSAIIRGTGVAAEGVMVGTAYDPSGPSARNRHFRAAYVNRYRHTPDVFAAQGCARFPRPAVTGHTREVVLAPSAQGHVAAVPAVYYDNTLPFSHALQPGWQPPESPAHSSVEFYPGVWQAGSR